MTEPPPDSNVTLSRKPAKRKRETTTSTSNKASRTSTPSAYARRSPPPEPKPISDDDDDEASYRARQRSNLKRPGAGARIAREQLLAAEAVRARRQDEERQQAQQHPASTTHRVAEHYNAVPERGREWRKTDSQIKGLRALNNWVKSTLIQKFSAPDVPPEHGLTVLDMACGKGGDLGKWEKAPLVPALYVGCDIADVSIEQARQRWAESRRKGGDYRRGGGQQMQVEFFVQDTFGQPLGGIPIVRQVGFDPNAGPASGGVIQGGMRSGGFDVVSIMFALHYSYESEDLARGMLRNVAGALKKGGRFIGVMPNSDVISAMVKSLLHAQGTPGQSNADDGANGTARDQGELEAAPAEEEEDDDWDPEKPSGPLAAAADGHKLADASNDAAADPSNDAAVAEDPDDWDPEKPSDEPTVTTTTPQGLPNSTTPPTTTTEVLSHNTTQAARTKNPNPPAPPLEWGNSLYTIRLPHINQPSPSGVPHNGLFRPPFGWRYHYSLAEAVDAPEFVVPWEAFRALAEEYGLELLYRKGFREVLREEAHGGGEMGKLAERMGVVGRNGEVLVGEEELEAAGFYHAWCFYKT